MGKQFHFQIFFTIVHLYCSNEIPKSGKIRKQRYKLSYSYKAVICQLCSLIGVVLHIFVSIYIKYYRKILDSHMEERTD